MEYSAEQKGVVAIVGSIILAIPIWLFVASAVAEAKREAAAEQAQRSGLGAWWHNHDEQQAGGIQIAGGAFAQFVAFAICYLFAPLPLSLIASGKEARQQEEVREQEQRRRAEMQASVQEMEADSQRQSQQMNLAQSKQSIVTQLGTLDQFIRVHLDETDRSRKLLSIQGAHSEVVQMSAKLASGEIDPAALRDSHVVRCARATIGDLCQSGLGNDRICIDLRRIFNIFER